MNCVSGLAFIVSVSGANCWVLSFSSITGIGLSAKKLEKVPEVPSPVCYNGCVYMCKNGGILTCMDAQNGSIFYQERIGAKGPYYSSPVVADGKLFIPSGNGTVTVIKANNKFDILAQNDLKEDIFASPAIIGNTIYIRTTGHLYAFGQK